MTFSTDVFMTTQEIQIVLSLIQGVNPPQLWFVSLVIAFSLAGNVGISLSFGISGANMTWDDPRQMQKTGVGCLGSIVILVYIPVSLVFFFAPILVIQYFELPTLLGQALGLLIGAAFSLVCAILPLRMVRKAVNHLGEN